MGVGDSNTENGGGRVGGQLLGHDVNYYSRIQGSQVGTVRQGFRESTLPTEDRVGSSPTFVLQGSTFFSLSSPRDLPHLPRGHPPIIRCLPPTWRPP